MTSAYHPQANGLTERFNQTLSNCLRAKINDEQNDWDEHLSLILFAYRATIQNSTKYSPFYMMFAREPSFPIDTEMLSEEPVHVGADSICDSKNTMDTLLEIQELIRSNAEANISRAQKKQKEQYDAKHQSQVLPVGEEVLLENTAEKQRKGGKMCAKWLGPYTIHKEMGKGVYQLKNSANKILKTCVNVKRLKKYKRNCYPTTPSTSGNPSTSINTLSTDPPTSNPSTSITTDPPTSNPSTSINTPSTDPPTSNPSTSITTDPPTSNPSTSITTDPPTSNPSTSINTPSTDPPTSNPSTSINTPSTDPPTSIIHQHLSILYNYYNY